MRSTRAVALAILPVVGAATRLAQQPPTFRHAAPLHLPSVPAEQYVLQVRAESSGAPGRPAIRQIPIAIR